MPNSAGCKLNISQQKSKHPIPIQCIKCVAVCWVVCFQSEGLSQIMRDTSSVGGCADASSVGTVDKSVTQSQSEGSIGSFFEKPKSKA